MAKQQDSPTTDLDSFLSFIDEGEPESADTPDAKDDDSNDPDGVEDDSDEDDSDDPVEEDDADDSESDPEPDKTVDPRDAQITLLTTQLTQLTEMVNSMKDAPKEEEQVSEVVDPLEGELFTSLADTMNWDDDESAKFKGFFKSYAEHVTNVAVKNMTDKTPDLVNSTMTKKQQQDKIASDFYSDYPELSGVREYVKVVAGDVVKELGASTPLKKVLEETAKRAYKALQLKRKKKKKADSDDDSKSARPRNPAFPQQKGVRKKPLKKSKQVSEIDAMLDGII